jgi:hypothetical protein
MPKSNRGDGIDKDTLQNICSISEGCRKPRRFVNQATMDPVQTVTGITARADGRVRAICGVAMDSPFNAVV